MSTRYRTCTLREAMCGLALEVEDGRVVSIRGDRDDPFSRELRLGGRSAATRR